MDLPILMGISIPHEFHIVLKLNRMGKPECPYRRVLTEVRCCKTVSFGTLCDTTITTSFTLVGSVWLCDELHDVRVSVVFPKQTRMSDFLKFWDLKHTASPNVCSEANHSIQ